MPYGHDRYNEPPSPELTGTVPSVITIRLRDIAYARSGDKGGGANIGVIAYNDEGYQYLCEHLTAERVADYFKPMGPGAVRRYELANLQALNFVLPEILAGGGSRSLRVDAQGKCLGQVLLEMELEIDPQQYTRCARKQR